MKLIGARVLILGLGLSGKAASIKLSKLGAKVTASDSFDSKEIRTLRKELESAGIEVILGPQDGSLLAGTDLVIVSPGIPTNASIITTARRRGIPVWSEIELAFRLTDKQIIAVTGTNGKTTAITLIGRIFEEAGRAASVAGNIGTPLVEAVTEPNIETLIVEVSSFQLDTIENFKPHIAVMLNVTEDHLDWHPGFDDYVRCKKRIFMNQDENDYAVVNIDDDIARSMMNEIKSRILTTSKKRNLQKNRSKNAEITDVFVEDNKIFVKNIFYNSDEPEDAKYLLVCSVDELKIPGVHNLDNAMAAIAVAGLTGIEIDVIREAIMDFEGLSHRIELIASVDRIDYYDDSKATNIDATVKAINSFSKPIVLMVGGRKKGNDYKTLANGSLNNVKAIVGFGEAGRDILAELPAGITKGYAESVDEATVVAGKLARPGYVVLFSPSCASFDAFKSYVERGNAFKNAVLNIGSINGN